MKYCDEYVCVCVGLSARISPEPHAQSLPFVCMLLTIYIKAGWRNSKGKGQFRVFFPSDSAFLQHSIWDPYKNSWTDAVCHEWAWPQEQCYVRVTIHEGEGAFGETCPTSLTPIWIANWTGTCMGMHTTSIASIVRVCYWLWRGYCTHGRSLISTIALLCLFCVKVHFVTDTCLLDLVFLY